VQKRIDYIAINKPLAVVLNDLSRKTSVPIVFSESKIPRRKKISIQADDERLIDIVKAVIKGTRLRVEVAGNQILIFRPDRNADGSYTLSGYIRDSITAEPLGFADVYDIESQRSARSNSQGFYSLTLPSGYYEIAYSYLGYAQDTVLVDFNLDNQIDRRMVSNVRINEVVIKDSPDVDAYKEAADVHHVSRGKMAATATLGGEVDVMRHLQLLPGVSSGADGFGGLNVRGGSDDQNLILYDGVPVYSTEHVFGLLSIFNSDIVASADFYKGNFPTRYAGRLSSVVDVKTRRGNTKKVSGSASISTLAAKVMLEGPLVPNKEHTFLVSYRRTYIDPWLKLATDFQNRNLNRDGSTSYSFSDLNGKLSFKINDKNYLSINYYGGQDGLRNSFTTANNITTGFRDFSVVNWDWQNDMVSLNWDRQLGDKAYSKAVAYYTSYELNTFDHSKLFSDTAVVTTLYDASVFRSRIIDRGGKWDLTYSPSSKHEIQVGGGGVLHKFEPALNSTSHFEADLPVEEVLTAEDLLEPIVPDDIFTIELNAYLGDVYRPSSNIEWHIGLHANGLLTDNREFVNLQPRLAFRASSGKSYVKAGISRMAQNLHRLQSSGLGFPSAVWIPATDRVGPAMSWVSTLTVGTAFTSDIQFVTSAYFKRLEGVSTLLEGALTPIGQDRLWERLIPQGKGTAYGFEVAFDKLVGRTIWNANYTYGVSTRDFVDVNAGQSFDFTYDRRHQAKLSLTHRISGNLEVAANYIYGTGNPITEPASSFIDETTGVPVLLFPGRNNNRLPDYRRLDVSFSFYNTMKFGRQKVTLGLYNVFNDKNYVFSDVARSSNNPETFELLRYTVVPLFPSLSYSLAW
jgi:hypothetical protein